MEDKKKILYFDMDNVLVDFPSGIARLSEETRKEYEGHLDEVHGIFSLMYPLPGAIEAVKLLSQYFTYYFLAFFSQRNIMTWQNIEDRTKREEWVQKYFNAGRRLLIMHHLNVNIVDFLITDKNFKGKFGGDGELILFGSERFPDWETVTDYLVHCAKGLQCIESIEYGKETATCLNEFSENEVSELKKFLEATVIHLSDISALRLIEKYPDKTFCIQRDYDYEFGNVSWEKPFLFYVDAEKHIEEDLQERRDADTPHYMIDKSYISIYPFSELQFLNRKERYDLVYSFYEELIKK